MANPERPKKVINAEFYQTDAGGEPVREFLRKEPTPAERTAAGKNIRTVEYGWRVGMPVCKDLKNGLLEVRTDLDRKICRILFAIYGSRMVLFHGLIKKSQSTPRAEMATALDRKRNMEQRR